MCMCNTLQEHSISNTVVLEIEMTKEEPGIPKTDDARQNRGMAAVNLCDTRHNGGGACWKGVTTQNR